MNLKTETDNSKPESTPEDPLESSEFTWPRLYSVVLAELAVLILLFYIFTKVFE